jgi:hypothetical protein
MVFAFSAIHHRACLTGLGMDMRNTIAAGLWVALMFGPHTAVSEESDEVAAIIRPYAESEISAETRVRCPSPSQVYEVSYINNAPQNNVVQAYFSGVGERTIRVRRGEIVEDIGIPNDPHPREAELAALQYRVEVTMLLCNTALSTVLIEGGLQVDGQAEGLHLSEEWNLEEIANKAGAPFTINFISNLLQSEPNPASQGLPSLMHRPGSSISFGAPLHLPITLYADASEETPLPGQLLIFLPSIPIKGPKE